MFLETICILDGIIGNALAHEERVLQTATHFGFTAQGRFVRELGRSLPSDLREGKVKCRVLYHETIEEITFERYQPKRVKSLKLMEAFPDYRFKYADRQALEALLQQKGECDEILITRDGFITDTSYSNVVLTQEGKLFTPARPLLNGTKRRKLLQMGIIQPKDIHRDSLGEYERVILINAMLDVEDDISLAVDRVHE